MPGVVPKTGGILQKLGIAPANHCVNGSLLLLKGVVDDRWFGNFVAGPEESPNTRRQHAARKRGRPPVKTAVDGKCHRKYTVSRKRDKGEKAG